MLCTDSEDSILSTKYESCQTVHDTAILSLERSLLSLSLSFQRMSYLRWM